MFHPLTPALVSQTYARQPAGRQRQPPLRNISEKPPRLQGRGGFFRLRQKLPCRLFARGNSAGGANVGTSAAIHAHVRVDRILLALRNSAGGAFVDTCAAGNAVVTNYVSHNRKFLIVINPLVCSMSGAKIRISPKQEKEKALFYFVFRPGWRNFAY